MTRTLIATLLICFGVAAKAATFNDQIGDATQGPDIASISASYDSTQFYISASFVPGTLDPAHLGLLFGVDKDSNRNTGCCQDQNAFFPIGSDFSLFFVSDNVTDAGRFTVAKVAANGVSKLTGYILPHFTATDVQISIPLSVLDDDGIVRIGLAAGVPLTTNSFRPYDFAFDQNNSQFFGPSSAGAPAWAYAAVFTPVPETGTAALLLFGLVTGLSRALTAQRRKGGLKSEVQHQPCKVVP